MCAQFLVETTIFGVLFWAPLILDAMLSGNFSGTNPKAATPAHQSNAELVRLQHARWSRNVLCGHSKILCNMLKATIWVARLSLTWHSVVRRAS